MCMVILTCIYGIIEFIVETIAWGSFGYIFFRFIGIKEKYWYWDCMLVFLILMLWEFILKAYFIKLEISIGNQEVLAFLDYDIKNLFRIDYLDFVFGALEILLGYLFGMLILKKLKIRQNLH